MEHRAEPEPRADISGVRTRAEAAGAFSLESQTAPEIPDDMSDVGTLSTVSPHEISRTAPQGGLDAAQIYGLIDHAGKSFFRPYKAATREMRTRFNILNDDLESRLDRNPIHHIEYRIKKISSISAKLLRYGKPQTLNAMREYVLDIAGVRVVCSYVDDVYSLVDMIMRQDDLDIIKVKDYIAYPKPNGYRSLHMIVKVPVYLHDVKEYVPVEVQLRTIAMDFWASLEHVLRYKRADIADDPEMNAELKECSETIRDVEDRMQALMHKVEAAPSTDEFNHLMERLGELRG